MTSEMQFKSGEFECSAEVRAEGVTWAKRLITEGQGYRVTLFPRHLGLDDRDRLSQEGWGLFDLLMRVPWATQIYFSFEPEMLVIVMLSIEIIDLNAYLTEHPFPGLEPSIAEIKVIISDFGKRLENAAASAEEIVNLDVGDTEEYPVSSARADALLDELAAMTPKDDSPQETDRPCTTPLIGMGKTGFDHGRRYFGSREPRPPMTPLPPPSGNSRPLDFPDRPEFIGE